MRFHRHVPRLKLFLWHLLWLNLACWIASLVGYAGTYGFGQIERMSYLELVYLPLIPGILVALAADLYLSSEAATIAALGGLYGCGLCVFAAFGVASPTIRRRRHARLVALIGIALAHGVLVFTACRVIVPIG